MYAVIRAGGKQYRVAPGDVIQVEKLGTGTDGEVQFPVLAVSSEAGQITQDSGARVVGQVLDEGRRPKVLVFHYKRKKQYKKLRGHRQGYTAVRITEIASGGQSFKAPELVEKQEKSKKSRKVQGEAAPAEEKAAKTAARRKTAAPKAAAKRTPNKKK